MGTRWIVVAHRTGAQIFENVGPGKGLRRVRDVDHPEGRLRDRDIDTDRPGMARDPHVSGMTGFQRQQSAHERDAQRFATELGEILLAARNEHLFDRVVLVAEPRFLGILRAAIDRQTAKMIELGVAKDLASADERTIAEHLSLVLPV